LLDASQFELSDLDQDLEIVKLKEPSKIEVLDQQKSRDNSAANMPY
jgi:hypothetical protein